MTEPEGGPPLLEPAAGPPPCKAAGTAPDGGPWASRLQLRQQRAVFDDFNAPPPPPLPAHMRSPASSAGEAWSPQRLSPAGRQLPDQTEDDLDNHERSALSPLSPYWESPGGSAYRAHRGCRKQTRLYTI